MRLAFDLLACPICKAIGLNRGLCAFCREQLWKHRDPFEREQSGYQVRSLFRWQKNGWPGLGWWLQSLKRKQRDAYWREAALWALETFSTVRNERPTLLVPIPSQSRKNHAVGFAQALARRRSGWRVGELLQPVTAEKQKNQDWSERWLRKFNLAGDSADLCKDYTSVIIVDDVVTTGATAEAAVQALGRPESCEVWVLADRRPCGVRAALL